MWLSTPDEVKNKNNWRGLTMEVIRIKEDVVKYIDFQAWADNMEKFISPIFTNILGRIQVL